MASGHSGISVNRLAVSVLVTTEIIVRMAVTIIIVFMLVFIALKVCFHFFVFAWLTQSGESVICGKSSITTLLRC